MTYGIYQAAAGAVARRNQVDLVANNLANGDTPGYRAQEVTFESVMHDVRAPDRNLVNTTETRLDVKPGVPVATGDPTDFALREPGYVRARGAAERPVLLRTANLLVNDDGLLADNRGHIIADREQGVIRLDREAAFDVTEDGFVRQRGQNVGRLWFQGVADDGALESLGAGAYGLTEASGEAFDNGNRILPGHIEGSNVQVLDGMVQLIDLERGFQANMKVIQAYREADEQLIEQTSR